MGSGVRHRKPELKGWIQPFSMMGMVGVCLSAPAAWAADTTITPFVQISESFTDNAFGSTTDEKSDFFTTVTAGVDLAVDSKRAEFDLGYELDRDQYIEESDLNTTRHQLLTDGSLEFIENWASIEGRVAVTEQDIISTSAETAGDRSINRNRSRVVNYSFGPVLEHSFGDWASTELSYKFNGVEFHQTDSDETTSQPEPTTVQKVTWGLDSGTSFNKFEWDLNASYEDTDTESASGTDDGQRSQNTNLEGDFGYLISSGITGTMRVGHDDNNDPSVTDNQNGAYGFVGVDLNANDRFLASLEVGERYDESTVEMSVEYLPSPRTSLSLTRTSVLQNQQQQLTDNASRDEDGDLVNPNEVSGGFLFETALTETTRAEFAHAFNDRTAFATSVTIVDREFSSDNTSSSTLSGEVALLHFLSRKLEGGVTVSFSDTLKTRTANTDETSVQLSGLLQYTMNESLTGTLGYVHLDRQDDADGDSSENLVTVRLRKTF